MAITGAVKHPQIYTVFARTTLLDVLSQAEGLTDDAARIAATICDFADYLDGNPLRWSPTVVELFMADWVPRKVIAEDGWFAALPDVVRAWVRFAGERRGLRAPLIADTAAAVDEWTDELNAGVQDGGAWGFGSPPSAPCASA